MTTDLHALITELANELDHNRQCLMDDRRLTHPLADKARAVLAGPVPVNERLPEPKDCDPEGRCWIHMPGLGTDPSWRLVDPRDIGPYHTHWLPAHALPLPRSQ